MAGCGHGSVALEVDSGIKPVDRLFPKVLATLPHDPTAFTQGLELVDGRLFETTGLLGKSGIREVDRSTGQLLRSAPLKDTWFGEGFTSMGDGRGIQLTWKDGRAVVWNLRTFTVETTIEYTGQGWGLCRLDDGRLVMSDGTDRLSIRDPADFRQIGGVDVSLDGEPVPQLNELECVGSTVWANIWLTNQIAAIEIETGRVTAIVDASDLMADRSGLGPDDVLNGIAYDSDTKRFLLTGKHWPTLYEVEFTGAGN